MLSPQSKVVLNVTSNAVFRHSTLLKEELLAKLKHCPFLIFSQDTKSLPAAGIDWWNNHLPLTVVRRSYLHYKETAYPSNQVNKSVCEAIISSPLKTAHHWDVTDSWTHNAPFLFILYYVTTCCLSYTVNSVQASCWYCFKIFQSQLKHLSPLLQFVITTKQSILSFNFWSIANLVN